MHFRAVSKRPLLRRRESVDADFRAQFNRSVRSAPIQANADGIGHAGDAVEASGNKDGIAYLPRAEPFLALAPQFRHFRPLPASHRGREVGEQRTVRHLSFGSIGTSGTSGASLTDDQAEICLVRAVAPSV